jgi:hypothetical protein
MEIIVDRVDPTSLRQTCQCGGDMRLVGIETNFKTQADVCTYQCVKCNFVGVFPPRVVH